MKKTVSLLLLLCASVLSMQALLIREVQPGDTVWYRISVVGTKPLCCTATNRHLTGQKSRRANRAQMWCFVQREDGAYHILSRSTHQYLSADGIERDELFRLAPTTPRKGWYVCPLSGEPNHFIIIAGRSQLFLRSSDFQFINHGEGADFTPSALFEIKEEKKR